MSETENFALFLFGFAFIKGLRVSCIPRPWQKMSLRFNGLLLQDREQKQRLSFFRVFLKKTWRFVFQNFKQQEKVAGCRLRVAGSLNSELSTLNTSLSRSQHVKLFGDNSWFVRSLGCNPGPVYLRDQDCSLNFDFTCIWLCRSRFQQSLPRPSRLRRGGDGRKLTAAALFQACFISPPFCFFPPLSPQARGPERGLQLILALLLSF